MVVARLRDPSHLKKADSGRDGRVLGRDEGPAVRNEGTSRTHIPIRYAGLKDSSRENPNLLQGERGGRRRKKGGGVKR